MPNGAFTTMAGHLAIIVMYVIHQVFVTWREGRRHRWQQEQFAQVQRAIHNGNGKDAPA